MLSTVADFNGDGNSDLAIGVHGENNLAGAVSVIYGTSSGLSAGGKFSQDDQFWSQDSASVAEVSEAGDQFGRTLAAGDFNGDGYSDLAIGVPLEDGTTVDSGAVHVLYGSAAGLTATGSQLWHQGLLGQTNETGDRFGGGLAVGDFNADQIDDLAIGRPGESVARDNDDQGGTDVIFGSIAGLTSLGSKSLLFGVAGIVYQTDQNGASLAAGDFNADGFDDLAVGLPGHPEGLFTRDSGAVLIYHGAFDGFFNPYFFTQDSSGISGSAEDNDRFGFSLSAGDFDNDGVDDLAIGVPFEDVGDLADAGAVHILYGVSGTGLTAAGSQLWTQDALADIPEAGDFFGVSLVAGDFNGDGRDDLAIGVSREDLPGATDAGAVNVILGTAAGLSATGNLLYHQNVVDIEDVAESMDQFGFALGASDFNGDGKADLAVGVIQENNSGAVNVIYGAATGLTAAGDQIWSQDSSGILDIAESGDFFGVAIPGTSGIGNGGFSGAWLNLSLSSKNQGSSDKQTLKGSIQVTNPGTEVVASSVVRFFLSEDSAFDADDLLLDEVNLSPLTSQQSVIMPLNVNLKNGQTAIDKYVIAVLDADDAVVELDETNNTLVFGPLSQSLAVASNFTDAPTRGRSTGSNPFLAQVVSTPIRHTVRWNPASRLVLSDDAWTHEKIEYLASKSTAGQSFPYDHVWDQVHTDLKR